MGYDMTTARPMTDYEQGIYNDAVTAFHAAHDARDALPKTEAGRFRDPAELKAEGIDWDDNRAFAGRSERFNAAQDAVDAAYEEMRRAQRSYFRLNIGGMGRYLDAMDNLGMLQDVAHPRPFPDGPQEPDDDFYDLAYEAKRALAAGTSGTGDNLPVRADVMAYAQDVYDLLSWTPEEVTGMATFKWGSNDGWHVLPKEITAALATYRTHTGESVRAALSKAGIQEQGWDYWAQWIAYLIYAESHGGFLVG